LVEQGATSEQEQEVIATSLKQYYAHFEGQTDRREGVEWECGMWNVGTFYERYNKIETFD